MQKLLLKSGQRAAILNAPDGYRALLTDLPANAELHETLDGTFDFLQVFVTRRDDVQREGTRWYAALAPNGSLATYSN